MRRNGGRFESTKQTSENDFGIFIDLREQVKVAVKVLGIVWQRKRLKGETRERLKGFNHIKKLLHGIDFGETDYVRLRMLTNKGTYGVRNGPPGRRIVEDVAVNFIYKFFIGDGRTLTDIFREVGSRGFLTANGFTAMVLNRLRKTVVGPRS